MPLPTAADFINGKQDLDDLAEMLNSPEDKLVPTRFGSLKRTLANWEARWAEAIANAGGVPIGDGVYSAGKTFSNYNEYVVDAGTPYRAVNVPYSVDVGSYPNAADDPNLRPWVFPGELAFSRMRWYADLSAALLPSYLQDGDLIAVAGRSSAGDGGFNIYEFDASGSGAHDGGAVITHANSGGQLRGLFPHGRNVKQWGAVGDGVADDTAAIQAALDALPGKGGQIYIPSGVYRITSALTVNKPNVSIRGDYGITFNETLGVNAFGSMLLLDAENTILLDFHGSSGLIHQGPSLLGMALAASSNVGTTLLRVRLMNRWRVEHCAFRGADIGIEVDRGGNDAAWGKVDHCFLKLNTIGLRASANVLVVGGDWENTTNIQGLAETGQIKVQGAKMDGGVGITLQSFASTIVGCTFENCSPGVEFDGTGVQPSGEDNIVIGCHFNGTGVETGIILTANAKVSQLIGNSYSNLGATVSDSGQGTVRIDQEVIDFGVANGEIRLASTARIVDFATIRGSANPFLSVRNDNVNGKDWRHRSNNDGSWALKNETDGYTPIGVDKNGGLRVYESASSPVAITDGAVLYTQDNGGKTELVVKWPGGSTTVLGMQP